MEKCVNDLGRGYFPKIPFTSHLAALSPNLCILEGSLRPAGSVCPKANTTLDWRNEILTLTSSSHA